MKQNIRERLEFIDSRLFWEEKISRNDLIDYFNISVPQATKDINEYTNKYPGNIYYDASTKVHRAKETYQPAYTSPSSSSYRDQLLVHSIESEVPFYYGEYPPFDYFRELNRPVDVENLKKISKAINNKKVIHITYHSLKKDRGKRKRWVAPHALVYDGFRLHMRAYCFTRVEFRDFNLGRIVDIEKQEFDSEIDFKQDFLWEANIDAIIKPHPEFVDHQKECIEREYEMKNGKRTVTIRAASVYYFYRKYGFDIEDYENSNKIPSNFQQIVLINKNDIDLQLGLLKKMSKEKLEAANYSIPEEFRQGQS